MKAEEQDTGSKNGFFSLIKRGLAGLSLEILPEAVGSQETNLAVLPQAEPVAEVSASVTKDCVQPSIEQTYPDEAEELVITCEGVAGPQIRRCRGHGPTITHASCPKAQAKWLLSEVEAVAIDDPSPSSGEVPIAVTSDIAQSTGSASEPRTISMANNLNESLNELMQIEGAIAVALVDGNSGMAMGTAGGGPLNLEVAAAGNSEVVRSKLKVMKALNLRENIEDILISLNTQYHLIRPLAKNPEVFIYLALNRSNANLAMARFKLASVEKQLEI